MSLRDSKLDSLSTNNINMRGRRTINASASVDPTDYVIKDELDKAIAAALAGSSKAISTIVETSGSTNGLKSPLDFGAVGDGLADDTAAVAAAVNALNYLWLPPTNIFITKKITIMTSDFCCFGGGELKLKAGEGTDLLYLDGSSFTGTLYPGNGLYAHIFGVRLHGNAAYQPVSTSTCLVLKNAAYASVQDNLIYAATGDGIRLENANGNFQADEINIINNRIFSNSRHGIYAHSTCLPVSTTIATSITVGVNVVTPASMTNITVGATLVVGGEYVPVISITGTTFTANFVNIHTGPGITVVSTFGHVGDHVIVGNHCNYNGRAGIRGTFLTSGILGLNNVLTNGIGIWLDAADRCALVSNACRNNKGTGVLIDQHAAVSYTDLVILTSNTVESVLKFSDEDVGLQLTITGGTGFTVQTVMITAVDSGTGVATVSANLGTPGSSGGIGSKTGFGRSNQVTISGGNQLHFNGNQTVADELDIFNTDNCVVNGNYLGNADFETLAISTTIAASISIGIQTVTPASMVGILPGTYLLAGNSDGSNTEAILISAITGSTCTAIFTTTKTGPGITLTSCQTQYGIQLFNSTGVVIGFNSFGGTGLIHGPLLAPLSAGRQHPYRSFGNIRLADYMQATQATLPLPATNDYGLICLVTDYQHALLWIGTQWVFANYGDSSGYIVNSVGGQLTGGVWTLCDGNVATVLQGDGTLLSITTPVLTPTFLPVGQDFFMRR